VPDPLDHPKKYAGFDLGKARIGVAVSDGLGLTAQPFGVFKAERDVAAQAAALARQAGAETLVLGLPKDASGEEGEQARWVRGLGRRIQAEHGLEVAYWDERLTTVQAAGEMRRAGLDSRAQRGKLDQVAAQLILQGFLDARAGSPR
jgi:putative Holliday junction resolvase